MMVSSLLAFNACKKDPVVGPAGPAGPTGATGAAGAAGAVGAAGATGAAGTKILPTTGAPTATTPAGAVTGDYAFDAATRILYGPRTATGTWAAVALSGTNGATGATGANGANGATGATGATGAAGAAGASGNKFLAGAGAPTAANPSNATTGDFYFDTTTSTFYGPKLADGTWANAFPISTAFTAKTYTITKGFEEMTAGTAVFGQDLVSTYSNYNIFSSYMITAGDMIRIAQYPARPDGSGGYSENREMIFESFPGSNVFNSVPTSANDLGSSTTELAGNPSQPNLGLPNMRVGAKFRYSMNTVNPLAEFTLTQDDIDRLKVQNGSAFGYLTYAKALPSSIALGSNLVFATTKNVKVNASTTRYYQTYTARTRFNLGTLIPDLEKYKQDGKVFLKYRYYNTAANNNATVVNHPGTDAGWADITQYINSYATAITGSNAAHATPGISNVNPFTLQTGAGLTGYAGANAPLNHPAGTGPLGTTTLTLAPSQVAIPNNVTTGTAANQTTFSNGNIVMNWNIQSGVNQGAVPTLIGLFQLQNGGSVADPVTVAYNTPSPATAQYVARNFATNYYSASTGTLTATDVNGQPIAIGAGDQINVVGNRLGQPATYFTGTNLVKLQVFVIPGQTVATLKAKGVDVDNVNEISKYIKL